VNATADARPQAAYFPGWRVIAGVSLVMFTSAGLGFYGLTVYLEAITDSLGFSVGSVSFATSVFFVVSGVCGVGIAKLIDRFDVRLVMAIGSVIGGVGLALLGQISELWQVYPAYAFFAVGFASCNLVPATTIIARWFRTKRAMALSVASTGLSVGGLVLVPLTSGWIDRDGLASVTPWLGGLYVVLIGVACLLVLPSPAALGFGPDGSTAAEGAAMAASGVSYADAVRTRFYWGVTIGYFLVLGTQVGAIAHLAKLGSDRVDRPTGAIAVSLMALGSVVGRLIGGVVAARVKLLTMTVVLAAVQSLSFVWLGLVDARWALLGGALVFGLTIGNVLMLRPLLLADAFGVVEYPRIFSRSDVITTLGVAAGPFVVGALHDASSYRFAYEAIAVIGACGIAVLLWGGPPERVGEQVAALTAASGAVR
jgi:MFS family permease